MGATQILEIVGGLGIETTREYLATETVLLFLVTWVVGAVITAIVFTSSSDDMEQNKRIMWTDTMTRTAFAAGLLVAAVATVASHPTVSIFGRMSK